MLFLYIGIFVLSLILVIYGGDIFVDNAVKIAKKSKIPIVIIGATIVSIATTLPELIVSSIASAQGVFGLAVGNAIGSVICNTALIGGLSMAVLPTKIKEKSSSFKYYMLLFSLLILFLSGFDSKGNYNISLFESIVLFIMFVLFISFNIIDASKQKKRKVDPDDYTIIENKDDEKPVEDKFILLISLFLLGSVMVALGAFGMVESAKFIASNMGISETVIGLTIVAVGTSLPELVTTITAVRKKNSELGYGNIVGANILNVLLIIGTSGILAGKVGLPIMKYTFLFCIPIAIVMGAIFLVPLICKNRSYRWQGILLLTLYIIYIITLVVLTAKGYSI
ncbi:MAG: calcium/sodium antiporter [Clostridia bacterium]|nr:calcium/sodium antiporter [Clostridia bacterium]